MRNRLNVVFIFLIILLFHPLHGIASQKTLLVKSYEINSISSLGFRSYKIYISVVIQNNSCDFFMENIQGIVYKKEEAILEVSMDDITISSGVTTIDANVAIVCSKRTSIFALICNLLFSSLDDYSADVCLLCRMADREDVPINRHIRWKDVSSP